MVYTENDVTGRAMTRSEPCVTCSVVSVTGSTTARLLRCGAMTAIRTQAQVCNMLLRAFAFRMSVRP